MKKIALLISVSALAMGAIAQGGKTKPAAAPTEVRCAVMQKDKVDIAKATKNHMFADYKGRRYFFCCGGCPNAFKANPEKYTKMAFKDSIPTPKKG